MADTITTVTNLDIQLLDADRSNATTIKLDNPKSNVTREQVSSAFQPVLTNGYFLTNNGTTAMYLGDVTINQSIKTKLDGEDFYITPTTLDYTINLDNSDTKVINVSGATIQGVNITDIQDSEDSIEFLAPNVSENGLSVNINLRAVATQDPDDPSTICKFNVKLVILGTEVSVPCTAKVV